MKVNILSIAIIWLLPPACWFAAPAADRLFAVGAGAVVAASLTVFFARQPVLRCGGCGAATVYFDNYTRTVARLTGNWHRYFVCRSCGETIDRMTGLPVAGVPNTPVVPPSSGRDVGRAAAGLGCLLVFAALVVGGLSLLAISRELGDVARAKQALSWCLGAAAAGIVIFLAGRHSSRRSR